MEMTFIFQEAYAKKVLERFKMQNCNPLTCIRPDILYGVGLVSHYMEAPSLTHLEIAERILRYIKGTLDYGLAYSSSTNFKVYGYSNSDWASDING
ncbi:uncharacterized protein LOC111400233 [Olea europaea var. sylvestris]|uniref:uncharacterized protein LOC111400233 n=1 Tax=Olea europaea var. sylvestris TaxID=158386 RepID=UPI000C1D5671|nr:uncharacterized protein LOC111400233 [Olea europaea var. sylvestris]